MVRDRVKRHQSRRADRAPERCRAGAASARRRNAPAPILCCNRLLHHNA